MTSTVNYMRQNRILDPEAAANLHVTIMGCGTVGSNAAIQLVRAGFKKFFICDMDNVEPHNLPSQDFAIDQLDTNKAQALFNRMTAISDGLRVHVQDEAGDPNDFFPEGVFISAVDSMELRKEFFERQVSLGQQELFIDFRMGGPILRAWCVPLSDDRRVEQYRGTLYSSEEAADEVCGTRTFAPVGALAGSFAAQFLTKHLREDDAPPFHVQMDLDNFQTMTVGYTMR